MNNNGPERITPTGQLANGLSEKREQTRLTQHSVSEEQIESCTELVRPIEMLDVIKEDPDGNRVLECAVAAGARFIVSGDNDLLRLGQFRNIRIVKVADFMKLITPP
jgi:predicted nucleic acid-binding protein